MLVGLAGAHPSEEGASQVAAVKIIKLGVEFWVCNVCNLRRQVDFTISLWVDVLWKRLDSDFSLGPWGETVPVTIEQELGLATIWLVDVHGSLDAEIVPVEVNASASLSSAAWGLGWLVVLIGRL